jgi:RNA polymerase sigma-70 factor (ECF subfamily)
VHDDAALIPSLLQNDERAWRIFHERYGQRLQGAISKVTRRFPQLTGTDHVQEIYAALCLRLLNDDKRRLRSFDPSRGTPLGCWLCALAKNSAYDFLRSRRRQPSLSRMGEESQELEPRCEAPDAFAVYCLREQACVVERMMESLSLRDQEFMAAYLQGLEAEQIAEQLGISVSTVYSKKHKILVRLEKLLQN